MKKAGIVFLAAIALFSFKPVAESIWKSDRSHSNIKFTISHMMISDVEGSFKTFDAKITASKDDFSDAVVEFTADVNSIDTENADRDKHLKAPDFFDAQKYPTFTFKSTEFKKVADKKYKVVGNLTLHGVTKEVTLDATYRGTIDHPYTKKKVAGFKVTGAINRTDFGIATSYGSAMLGEEVTFTANAEFIKE
ncbi:MAG TPA: YceI family protein [Chryseosolibacter sp.]|nr:YceI family protein [Chryseosolibacter sp.]